MGEDEIVGTVVAERYRVLRLLGRGAAGAVYLVEHVHMRKRLALKVLNADTNRSTELVARFEREAVAAANMEHPNVAAATDFGRLPDGSFFLVLEYVEGTTLAKAIGGRPMGARRAVAIARQIASALVRAHDLGIVHRDLKPENVLLGDRDTVKILDFGIAKLREGELRRRTMASDGEALTRAGLLYGTPQYMAPEQALGEAVDARADLWALGVMLFEMLTGTLPFAGDDLTQLLGQVITGAAPRIADRAPDADTPAALDALVMRLLAKQAADRPASAREVLDTLDAFADAERPDAGASGTPDAVARGDADARSAAGARAEADAERDAVGHARTVAAGLPRIILVPAASRRGLIVVALAVGVLGAIAGAAVLRAGPRADGPRGLVQANAGGHAAPDAPPSLRDDEVQRAEQDGPDAVRRLLERQPDDVRLRRALVQSSLAAGKIDEGIAALDALVQDVPDLASSPQGAALATAATTAAATGHDAAFTVLETRFGARGVDALLDLASRPGPGRARAERALAKPSVRAHATPAAAVALDLRAAGGCDAKYALLARAKKDGDARSLPYLRPLTATKGCGFLNLSDCWRCLRRDNSLHDAISTLEARR